MNATNLFTNMSNVIYDDDVIHFEDKSSVNFAKFVTIFVLFLISMSSGIGPLILLRWFNLRDPRQDPRTYLAFSSLLSFGGGALLSTTLMHLLPEIDETVSDLKVKGHIPELSFSFANLLLAVGFFIIYLMEEMVHTYLRKQQGKAQGAFARGHSARESLKEFTIRVKNEKKSDTDGVINILSTDLVKNEYVQESHNHHHHSHIVPATDGDNLLISSIRGLLIVLALSIHELFEGIVVGLEQSQSTVWYNFIIYLTITTSLLSLGICLVQYQLIKL